ncbi:Outer membrane receptor for ferrienterochelin and colicins [Algoriphagus locisalis]|uniref:Outer membrane receptor for ferrienterochelin and colicins n=1 Tax=Algoriphagus locisalis TaxID=305507 RepID=A0A1I7E946_9BACT|nr:TonB-dependent receptor [Algoriphagus locisalis]SFU20444.1 Outer membrane receptor for ferrienterochelin and colicins [Algoriphagus locisalis]
MNKLFLFIGCLFAPALLFAQYSIIGKVQSASKEPLVGASIKVLDKDQGAITNLDGQFELENVLKTDRIVVSYLGYEADTLSPVFDKTMLITLQESGEALEGVTVRARSESVVDEAPFLNILITENELQKAACCNLSESFETNASVDVSYADAVTGTKMIQMMGLDGRYVLISREGIPNIRGLNSRLGLTYVPGTWIQSIDVGKGAGTVINGYESMTGQINVDLFKPESMDKWYLNAYLNSFGRMEVNANHQIPISEKWSSGVLFHASQLSSEIDGNDDEFLDLPKSRQLNFLNRYKYEGDRLMAQIGVNLFMSDNAGGQKGFDFNSDLATSSMYGYEMDTRKAEIFGKLGMIYPDKPTQSWGFQYSLSYQDFNGGAGRRIYQGIEKTAYGNFIYQNILGSSFHQYKTGASFLYDDFEETFDSNSPKGLDTAMYRTEKVPGLFFEYNFIPNDRVTLVAGARTDFHNLFGTYFTPRVHARWEVIPNWTVRGSVGKGYRTPNALMENSSVWISSRELVFNAELKPEESWNTGLSLAGSFTVDERPLSVVADYFHTNFINQLVYDRDVSSEQLVINNLHNGSYANSFQIEASYPITDRFEAKAAYKHYEMLMTTNGILQQMPLTSRNRFFMNLAYATDYDKWKADMTLNWNGPMRIPNTSESPVEFQQPSESPDFFMLNAQVSRGFRWGSIYLGGENILNFKQSNPIIDPENPFGQNFDASMTWGPIAGRVIYTGIRYKIN